MSENDRQGGGVGRNLSDTDAEDMKALRSWMFRVNSYLHQSGTIDSKRRQELMDLASEATGWDHDDE